MAAQQVGRILLIPKGDYSASAVYNSLDWVRFGGAAWVCKVDGTTNITPTTSTPEWQLMAEDGTVGGWSSLSGKPFDSVGDGLNVNSTNELEVDVGDGLKINSTAKKVEVDKSTSVASGDTKPVTSGAVYSKLTSDYYTKSDVDAKMQRAVQYAGTKQFTDLTSSLLNSTYFNNFFMLTDDGEITSSNINLWNDNFIVGDHIPKDSHIAVIAYTGSDASKGSYVFDDFGGFVDISGKLDKDIFNAVNRRTPQNITSRIQADSGASLLNAIADQDLAKYGYSIGDYFESPTNRSLVTQTYSSGSVKTQTVNVKFKYYLADMDAWYGGYDSYEVVGTHHVELLVDCMINRQWHSASDITNVGYDLSALYTYLKGSILDAIKADMKALFGGSTGLEHLLSHQLYLTKSFTACGWVTTYIHTPSEFEVYGGNAFSGNDAQRYAFNKKLALFDKFRFNQILGSGNSMWLYNMYSASSACVASAAGFASPNSPVDTGRAAGLILLH